MDEEKFLNSNILNSKVFKVKEELDTRYIHFPSNLSKVLTRINPQVVVAWEYNPAALESLVWCRVRGRKFIHLTDGTLHSERNIGRFQKLARKIICSSTDACIASSTKAKEKLISYGVKEEKIFLSLLTVDISSFNKVERERIPGRILYVGSMVKRKGLDLLISALPYIADEYELHIVGNGSEEQIEELKRLAIQKGVANKIVWRGFKEKEELWKEYSQANVFVLPTREDCFGLVLLEALCAGVPIVSSKYADGAYDTILPGVNGVIVDPFKAKEMGEAISDVLANEQYYNYEGTDDIKDKFLFENVSKGYEKAITYALRDKK